MLACRMAILENNVEELTLHLHEMFYPLFLAAVADRRWFLMHGVKLAVVKCLNSPDYVVASRKVISSAIIKGIQEELVAGLAHSKLGADLSGVTAHCPSTEANYQSALQALCDFEFPLFSDLLAYKDARITNFMDLLRLESPLADVSDMADLQPAPEQLFVPIQHSEDSVSMGAEPLSYALEKYQWKVSNIKESIAATEAALAQCCKPFLEPLLIHASTGSPTVLGGSSDVPGITTSLPIEPSAPVLSEACDAVGTDAHAVHGDCPSVDDSIYAPASSSVEEKIVATETHESF